MTFFPSSRRVSPNSSRSFRVMLRLERQHRSLPAHPHRIRSPGFRCHPSSRVPPWPVRTRKVLSTSAITCPTRLQRTVILEICIRIWDRDRFARRATSHQQVFQLTAAANRVKTTSCPAVRAKHSFSILTKSSTSKTV